MSLPTAAACLKQSYTSLVPYIGNYENLKNAGKFKRNYEGLATAIRNVYTGAKIPESFLDELTELLERTMWNHHHFLQAIFGELILGAHTIPLVQEHLSSYVILLSKEHISVICTSSNPKDLTTMARSLLSAYSFDVVAKTIDSEFELVVPLDPTGNPVTGLESFDLQFRNVFTGSKPDALSSSMSEDKFIEKLQQIAQKSSFEGMWATIKDLLRETPTALLTEDPIKALLTTAAYHEWQ